MTRLHVSEMIVLLFPADQAYKNKIPTAAILASSAIWMALRATLSFTLEVVTF
jgi:hypothetical protein